MGKKSQPAQPDPAATAQAQAAYNKDAAITQNEINMINQSTPYGSLTYEQTGKSEYGTPQYTAKQELSPEQQQLYDLTSQAGIKYGQTANNQLDSVSGALSSPLNFGSLGAAPQANEDVRGSVADSLYQRIDPQLQRDEAALQTQLANQGIMIGSDAYNSEMDRFARQKNDLRLGIDAQAGDEMARMYGLESAARNQNINEMLQQRSVPINELAAMISGAQVQNPSFTNTPQAGVAAPDYLGATYQGYNTASQAANAQTQGMYGLLGAGTQGYLYGAGRQGSFNPFKWGK